METTKQYLYAPYDFIDNGAGELMMVMDVPGAGEADDDLAKFIYDGASQAALIRNSEQIVHIPLIPEEVGKMLNEIKIILITEMEGDEISNVYEAPVEISSN